MRGLSHAVRVPGLGGDALEQSADDQISAPTHLHVPAGPLPAAARVSPPRLAGAGAGAGEPTATQTCSLFLYLVMVSPYSRSLLARRRARMLTLPSVFKGRVVMVDENKVDV